MSCCSLALFTATGSPDNELSGKTHVWTKLVSRTPKEPNLKKENTHTTTVQRLSWTRHCLFYNLQNKSNAPYLQFDICFSSLRRARHKAHSYSRTSEFGYGTTGRIVKETLSWSLRACCDMKAYWRHCIFLGIRLQMDLQVFDVYFDERKGSSCPLFHRPLTYELSFPLTAYPNVVMWMCGAQPGSTLGSLLAFSTHVFQFQPWKKKKRKTEKISLAIDDVDVFFSFFCLEDRDGRNGCHLKNCKPSLRWNLYPALAFYCHNHVFVNVLDANKTKVIPYADIVYTLACWPIWMIWNELPC